MATRGLIIVEMKADNDFQLVYRYISSLSKNENIL